MMVNLPVFLIAMALLLLAHLPSSAAFSATLKAQGNETKVSYPSTSPDSETEAEAPVEVESWTEALSSPTVQEPGNAFVLQVQLHSQTQTKKEDVGLADVLQDVFNNIDYLTKKELTKFCEYGLYSVDIMEQWLDQLGPAGLKDKALGYLDRESGKGLDNALRDTMNAIHDAMMENPTRMKRFLSEEEAVLLQEDPGALREKGQEEVEECVGVWSTFVSNEVFTADKVDALKRMEAAEMHVKLKEALRHTKTFFKNLRKLNPKRRNFDVKLVRCVLKFLLPPQQYAAISMSIPHLVKQLRNAQNAHNPLLADM